jgi:hypothetical protein
MRHAGHHMDDTAVVALTAPQNLSTEAKPPSHNRADRRKRSAELRTSPSLRVLLSPAGTFVTSGIATEQQLERGRQLAIAIRQRIESRLLGRVRELSIRVEGETVFLDGRCATFYTKQLAQHAALAVLEDEQLVNNIAVALP